MATNVDTDGVKKFIRDLSQKKLSNSEQLAEMAQWGQDNVLTPPARTRLNRAVRELTIVLQSPRVARLAEQPVEQPEVCIVVCAAVIRDKKILLVESDDVWILPGGEKELNESETQCLLRQGKKELSGAIFSNCRAYRVFVGLIPHSENPPEVRVFLSDTENTPFPSGKITALMWTGTPERYPLSNVTVKIIEALRQDGYL